MPRKRDHRAIEHSEYHIVLVGQIREFSWAWNQWTGLKQPYIGFFSFVPMDIYPTGSRPS